MIILEEILCGAVEMYWINIIFFLLFRLLHDHIVEQHLSKTVSIKTEQKLILIKLGCTAGLLHSKLCDKTLCTLLQFMNFGKQHNIISDIAKP